MKVFSRCIKKEVWFNDMVSGKPVFMFWLKNGNQFMAEKRFSLFRVPIGKARIEIHWAVWRDMKYFIN